MKRTNELKERRKKKNELKRIQQKGREQDDMVTKNTRTKKEENLTRCMII